MQNWIFNWSAQYPLYIAETSSQRLLLVKELFNDSIKDFVIFSKNKEMCCYHIENSERELKACKKYLDPNFIQSILKRSNDLQQEYWDISKHLNEQSIVSLNKNELIQIFQKMYENFSKIFCVFELSRPEYTMLIEKKINDILKKKNFNENLLLELLLPVVQDEIMKEQNQWLEFFLKDRDNDALYEYAKNNKWILGGVIDEDEIRTFITKRYYEINKLSKDEIKRKLLLAKSQLELNKEKIKKLKSKIDSKELESLLNILNVLSIDRAKVKKVWSDAWYIINQLFFEISKRSNVNFDELIYYYKQEDIVNLIHSKVKLSNDVIQKRNQCYVYEFLNDKISFYEGKEAAVNVQAIFDQIYKITEINGQVAYPGKHTGRAVVVPITDLENLTKKIEEFKKGDILITQMTQPNMVILMEKAGAVVTDEGGITSHAAVVSRELKIPCIVGTGIATQKIKTGDIIKVDADRGVVKNKN